jgi:hypothetical protein
MMIARKWGTVRATRLLLALLCVAALAEEALLLA